MNSGYLNSSLGVPIRRWRTEPSYMHEARALAACRSGADGTATATLTASPRTARTPAAR